MSTMKIITDIQSSRAHHWLVTCQGSIAVSYARVLLTDFGALVGLAEIETRLEFQHYGYASELLAKLSEHYAVTRLPHCGRYTLDGYHFVRDKVDDYCSDARLLEPMTFVDDWPSMRPKVW